MPERLRNIYNRTMERLRALDRNQKIKFAITASAVVISLVALILLLARPNWITIYQNLDYSQASEITNALNNANIRSRPVNNSTAIQVNEKDADAAMMYLAERDVPRGGKFDFATAFTFMGMGTTETVKRKVMGIYDEKDLEDKLKKMDGVADASVTLVPASDDRYFLKDEQKARASVQLFSDKSFSKAEATNIARYISKCVRNLEMEDIVIINGRFETIYSGTDQNVGGVNSQEELRQLRTQETENKVRMLLLPLFDDVRIYANITLNWDKQVESSTQYGVPLPDSETGIPIRESTSQSSVSGGAPEEEPGTGSNSGTSPSYQVGSESNYSGSTRERDTDYAIDVFESLREYATGVVDNEKSSLAVMLYKYREYKEQELSDNDLLNGMSWAEFKAVNSGQQLRELDPRLEVLLREIGIKNVSVLSYELPVFVDREPPEPLKIEQIVLFAIMTLLILLLAFGLIRKTQPDEITEIEPELSVEELLVSTQMEDEKIAEVEKLQEIAFNQESEAKRQIEKFIQEKPEAVAQLLRNWLNDEWGD